jgi:hypothetical protein
MQLFVNGDVAFHGDVAMPPPLVPSRRARPYRYQVRVRHRRVGLAPHLEGSRSVPAQPRQVLGGKHVVTTSSWTGKAITWFR